MDVAIFNVSGAQGPVLVHLLSELKPRGFILRRRLEVVNIAQTAPDYGGLMVRRRASMRFPWTPALTWLTTPAGVLSPALV